MKGNERNLMLLSAVALSLLFLPMVNAEGLGMSPVKFELSNLIRGQEYKSSMITIHSSFETEVILSLSVEGNCSDWVTLYLFKDQSKAVTNVTLQPLSSTQLIANFKISEDAEAGKYACTIYAKQILVPGQEEQIIAIKLKTDIILGVIGGDIPKGAVRGITIANPELGQPLKIEIVFENIGNVTATPRIKANITKDGAILDQIDYSQTTVEPKGVKTITIEKNTTGWGVGEYFVPMKVYLISVIYDRPDLGFKILEQGANQNNEQQSNSQGGSTSTPSQDSSTGEGNEATDNLKVIEISVSYEGKILNVSVPAKINLGDMVKTEITFSNTGTADIRAKAEAEIYSNGKFVSVIQGDEILLKVGETRTLTLYFKPEEVGKYQIKPSVVYEGKKIVIDPVSFAVSGFSMPTGMAILAPGLGILGIIVLVVALVLWNKKKQKQQYVVRKRWGH